MPAPINIWVFLFLASAASGDIGSSSPSSAPNGRGSGTSV